MCHVFLQPSALPVTLAIENKKITHTHSRTYTHRHNMPCSVHKVRQAPGIPPGRTECFFLSLSILLPGLLSHSARLRPVTPLSLLWNLPALFMFGCDSALTSCPHFLLWSLWSRRYLWATKRQRASGQHLKMCSQTAAAALCVCSFT